jgi:hypothetical protein
MIETRHADSRLLPISTVSQITDALLA